MQVQPGEGFCLCPQKPSPPAARGQACSVGLQSSSGLVRHAVSVTAQPPEPGYDLQLGDHLLLDPSREIENKNIYH